MLTKRIIACLDIKDGRTVKGLQFENLQDAGCPIELAKRYEKLGIDELVFLDITASHERRRTVIELAQTIAQNLSIPFCVGGGIKDWQTAVEIIQTGADKITVNSSAVINPNLIKDISHYLGSQAVVVAIDAKQNTNKEWEVFINGGRKKTALKLFDWAKEVQDLGAGEILFTSMDHDGTKKGFVLEALEKLSQELTIPVIASGGAGSIKDFIDVFSQTQCSAALAASIFHYETIQLKDLKIALHNQKIPIRLL